MATAALRRVFHGEQRGPAPFAARGQALKDAQEDEQQGSSDADGGVGRQHTDQSGGHTHEDQGAGEHLLAPDAVAQVARDGGAEGAEEEADAQGCPGENLREAGVIAAGGGEELRTEHEAGGLGVDEEVVPLDGRAYERGAKDAPVF